MNFVYTQSHTRVRSAPCEFGEDTAQFWTDTMNRLWICLYLSVGIESGLRRDGLLPPLKEELMTLTPLPPPGQAVIWTCSMGQ